MSVSLEQIVVICSAAVDDRSGGGMRIVVDHLEDAPKPLKVISLHLWERPSDEVHSLDSVDFIRLESGQGAAALPRLVGATRKILRAFSPATTRVLSLPTSPADVVMSWAATTTYLPVDVWFMDDFISALGNTSRIKQAASAWFYAQLYRRCDRRIVIGDAMREEYGRRYGRPAELTMGKAWKRADIERAHALRRQRPPPAEGEPVRLVWAGSWLPYYAEPLQTLARLLRHRPELPVVLDLYGLWPPPAEALADDKIRYCGSFEDAELPDILAGYDYGLLCYSSDPATVDFMRFSFPGKLADYFCAGLPVAAIVPDGIKMRRELEQSERHVVAASLDETNVAEWVGKLHAARSQLVCHSEAFRFVREDNVRKLLVF